MQKVLKKYSKSSISIGIAIYSALALLAIVCVIPMWHVLMASLSSPLAFGGFEGFLFAPINFNFSLESFAILFTHKFLLRSYANTIFYTGATVAIGLAVGFMAAYALTKKNMLLKRPLLLMILITMFFNGGMVPFYITVNQLGLIDTVWAMILPTCCGAMNIIMLRTGIMSIPDAVFEAAEIDGASAVGRMVKIALPLSAPYIIVVALFSGVASWNSWVNADMFLSARHVELYPLQLVLRDILTGNMSNMGIKVPGGFLEMYVEGIRMAAVIVASLPLIIAYPFLQKHFEKGMLIGSVKG